MAAAAHPRWVSPHGPALPEPSLCHEQAELGLSEAGEGRVQLQTLPQCGAGGEGSRTTQGQRGCAHLALSPLPAVLALFPD